MQTKLTTRRQKSNVVVVVVVGRGGGATTKRRRTWRFRSSARSPSASASIRRCSCCRYIYLCITHTHTVFRVARCERECSVVPFFVISSPKRSLCSTYVGDDVLFVCVYAADLDAAKRRRIFEWLRSHSVWMFLSRLLFVIDVFNRHMIQIGLLLNIFW